MGWEVWLDLDLWTRDLKIYRYHLLIEGNPCTKFGIDQVKESKDIDRTTLGLQTDRPTYRPTYRPTVVKQYAPFFKGGIINNKCIDDQDNSYKFTLFLWRLQWKKPIVSWVWDHIEQLLPKSMLAESLITRSYPIHTQGPHTTCRTGWSTLKVLSLFIIKKVCGI